MKICEFEWAVYPSFILLRSALCRFGVAVDGLDSHVNIHVIHILTSSFSGPTRGIGTAVFDVAFHRTIHLRLIGLEPLFKYVCCTGPSLGHSWFTGASAGRILHLVFYRPEGAISAKESFAFGLFYRP
eukprot:jgi/Botrbrau1/6895/Bobra.67_3s0014.1